MADVSVRPARPDDAPEIGRIQVETWRFGYQQILPEPVLASLDPATAGEAWRAAISAPPSPRHHVLVAQEGEWTVGFAAFVPDEAEGSILVGPVLVEPRWGRRGHASRLMAAAVDTARADGATTAAMWVPESDAATREFLAGSGWVQDGTVRALDTGAGELREVRLHVSLSES